MGADDEELDFAVELCNTVVGECERAGCGEGEQPTHIVALDGFWIDRTEVTHAQLRSCVEAGACTPPLGAPSGWGEPGKSDGPVVNVT